MHDRLSLIAKSEVRKEISTWFDIKTACTKIIQSLQPLLDPMLLQITQANTKYSEEFVFLAAVAFGNIIGK